MSVSHCRACALEMVKIGVLARLLRDVESMAGRQYWNLREDSMRATAFVPDDRGLELLQDRKRALTHMLSDVERLAKSQDWRLARIMDRAEACETIEEIEAMIGVYGEHESDLRPPTSSTDGRMLPL